ncbi:Glutathione S-transferase [Pleurostoma richardsiae]|uniref:Glutathione S-transferase n=1 Tax=Pleurostoma richardsiae TaxID=41990 RepID=A0AA38R4B1_9PEZI|nr:Glutathione S-transferase [Pleurostoma richardsiae]
MADDKREEDPIRYKAGADGKFNRPVSTFRDVVSKAASSKYPAEKGRYAIYVSPGCPWCHRTMIVRALKRLEGIVDLYETELSMGKDGWFFATEDPLYGFKTVKQLYLKADPGFSGRFTVPVLWDKKANTMVNNESSEIIRMLYAEFDDLLPEADREARRPGGGLYPEPLRSDIDELNDWVYHTVNNGVYKTGFASTQQAYEENLYPLFASLDRLEERLAAGGPFLLGENITEADVRLFPTVARFDTAYNPVFMCNLKSVRHDYPHLYLWFRRLYWDESDKTHGAFHKTTQPWMSKHAQGYQTSRFRVLGIQGPLIVPRGPAVMIDELKEVEAL